VSHDPQRLFVAIELDDAVRSALVAEQRWLKQALPKGCIGWSRPELMHLTLRFLGDVADARLDELSSSLAEVVARHGSLALTCERLGCFPDLRFPRVVWAWVHGEGLEALQAEVSTAGESFAVGAPDKQFTGHITLGRTRRIRRSETERIAASVEGRVSRLFGKWTTKEVVLFRSELRPDGARHEAVARFPLRPREA
jgi:2'-5' RNA ligase